PTLRSRAPRGLLEAFPPPLRAPRGEGQGGGPSAVLPRFEEPLQVAVVALDVALDHPPEKRRGQAVEPAGVSVHDLGDVAAIFAVRFDLAGDGDREGGTLTRLDGD